MLFLVDFFKPSFLSIAGNGRNPLRVNCFPFLPNSLSTLLYALVVAKFSFFPPTFRIMKLVVGHFLSISLACFFDNEFLLCFPAKMCDRVRILYVQHNPFVFNRFILTLFWARPFFFLEKERRRKRERESRLAEASPLPPLGS